MTSVPDGHTPTLALCALMPLTTEHSNRRRGSRKLYGIIIS